VCGAIKGFPTIPREWLGGMLWFATSQCHITIQTRGVLQCGPAIYVKKYLKAKEELQKLKYFTIHHLQKNPLKRNQNRSFKII
jgi:hypothetical protein